MKSKLQLNGVSTASIVGNKNLHSGLKLKGMYEFWCFDRHGRVKWYDSAYNVVTNAGLDYLLDAGLSGASPITTWYLGLTDDSPSVNAADTLASHAGWEEANPYSGNRPTWSEGGVSSQSITNSGSPASFSITGSDTVGGAFLASVNSGTSGTLLSVVAFSGGDKVVDDGDTLNVTYSLSAVDA